MARFALGRGLKSFSDEDVLNLCRHILSGDMWREIENSAFERAAVLVEEPIAGLEAQHQNWCESFGKDRAQPHNDEISLRRDLAQKVRNLIQPPAQKDEKK